MAQDYRGIREWRIWERSVRCGLRELRVEELFLVILSEVPCFVFFSLGRTANGVSKVARYYVWP